MKEKAKNLSFKRFPLQLLILKSDGTLVIDTEEADFKDTVFSKE